MSVITETRPTTTDSASPAPDATNSPAPLFTLDAKGNISWQNAASKAIAGAQDFWSRVDEQHRERLRAARTEFSTGPIEFRLHAPDVWLRESLHVRRDESGQVTGCDGCWQDISRERKAAERLARADVCEANRETLRCKLHDLANTIAGIQSVADNLGFAAGTTDEIRESAGSITRAAFEARDAIQSIGGQLKSGNSPPEYYDARQEIQDTLELLRHAIPPTVTVSLVSEAESTLVNGVVRDFRIAIANLIVNAGEAIAGEGQLNVSLHTDSDTLLIRFADTGPGFGESTPESVTTPWWTTREGSPLGLGLAQVRAFAEAAGGSLTIGDHQPRGATVSLRLPSPS